MRVSLLVYTPDALEVLLFTKQTRLSLSPGLFEEIKAWPDARKQEELDYMLGTIQSSWEFVDYIFVIEGVSRAFTHQFVRHRVGTSFAQQAQRVVDMSGFEYVTGPSIQNGSETLQLEWAEAMRLIDDYYQQLLDEGANPQDARGILPTNICTNIIFKVNLRALHDQMLKRLCVKAQGEAQDVYRSMREQVVAVHPWADKFLKVWCAFYGTCCFPTYPQEKCPAKPHVYDPRQQTAYNGYKPASLATIERLWRDNRAEAQPTAPAR